MIITVLTGEKDEVLGIVEGRVAQEDPARVPIARATEDATQATLEAGLVAEPGQQLAEIEVGDDFSLLLAPSEVSEHLKTCRNR